MSQAKKRKILLLTPGPSFFVDPYSRAFSRIGYECKKFDCRSGIFSTNKIIKKIINRVPALRFLKRRQIDRMNRTLIKLVREFEPEYIFAQKGESVYPETIIEIKKMGVIMINFYNDMMGHWHIISRLAPVYDYFFTVDCLVLKRLREELRLKNCFYMGGAAEPMADPFKNRKNEYNICFIGTHNNGLYSNREKSLVAVGDLGLHVWGNDAWAETSVKESFHGRSFDDERFDIYSRSKIVLDTTWDLMPTEFVASRAFEAMGCGALYMTDCDKEIVKKTYVEDKEIVFFRDEKELREKVIYYLKHDKEREAIAWAGYARTVAMHTYDERVKEILNIINNTKRSNGK